MRVRYLPHSSIVTLVRGDQRSSAVYDKVAMLKAVSASRGSVLSKAWDVAKAHRGVYRSVDSWPLCARGTFKPQTPIYCTRENVQTPLTLDDY